MLVPLDGERLEPPLPDMPAGVVVLVIPADVRREQPLHPPPQVPVLPRPQHEVKVVGHQTPTHQPHRNPLAGGSEQADEGGIVVRLMKHLGPRVPPVENVITPIPQRRSSGPRHATNLAPKGSARQSEKVECPLFRPSALSAGKIVILDRYFYSTIAYQGARGADDNSVAGDMRTIFPIPDVAILIDADPAVTIQRIAVGRGETPNHFERVDELEKVREIFLDLAKTDDVIRVIDGNQSIQAVYRAIVEVVVQGVLKKKRCAKDYDCDYLYCAPRLAGQCRWAEIAPELLGTTARPTALIK
jgi:hypothetical protein